MRARADSTIATRERILDAAYASIFERSYDELTLQLVAERAGVTFQTVLRHFGTKDGLIAATAQARAGREAQYRKARPGDAHDVARVLAARYEVIADAMYNYEALEDKNAVLGEALARARNMHGAWLEQMFGAALAKRPGAARRELLVQLYAVTDINTYRLWRRRLGLGPKQATAAMARAIEALLNHRPR